METFQILALKDRPSQQVKTPAEISEVIRQITAWFATFGIQDFSNGPGFDRSVSQFHPQLGSQLIAVMVPYVVSSFGDLALAYSSTSLPCRLSSRLFWGIRV
jgi:hypothetical protein